MTISEMLIDCATDPEFWAMCVFYDDWEEEWDEAAEECGLLPPQLGGGCSLGGTEHCDFECPFRDTSQSSHGDLLE